MYELATPPNQISEQKLSPVQEWAVYIGVSKNTIIARLKKCRLLYEYDPRNIYSVFDVFKFLLKR